MRKFIATLRYVRQVGPEQWREDRVARAFDIDTPVLAVMTWAEAVYSQRPGWPNKYRPCLADIEITDLITEHDSREDG